MLIYCNIIHFATFFVFLNIVFAQEQKDNPQDALEALDASINIADSNFFSISDKLNSNENVDVKVYYESLCPGSIDFYVNVLRITVENLSQYLNVHTYPYGNAETIVDKNNITFICQHGPAECYGNKLHACTIDHLQNITKAIIFNACLMDKKRGSDDAAADKCGTLMDVDPKPIKECAKGSRGIQLLQEYGVESEKAGFNSVPYILINDRVTGIYFVKDVCSAFTVPPPPCKDILF